MAIMVHQVNDNFAVTGQLGLDQLEEAKAKGFASIINNRPDHEENGQPLSRELAAKAAELGLGYAHIPVSGPIDDGQTEAMQHALASLPGPVLGFCRSGQRSTRLWAHAMAPQQGLEKTLHEAAGVGCDAATLQVELAHKAM